jgi:mannose-6-phosphate isomerase-like protein (cupin superfamily)
LHGKFAQALRIFNNLCISSGIRAEANKSSRRIPLRNRAGHRESGRRASPRHTRDDRPTPDPEPAMSTPAAPAYDYDTHLDIKYASGEVIDVPALVAACTHPWYNQTLCRVNESVVRLGVVQGEYHWHKHDDEDEFFHVVSGRFLIELEDRTVDLAPGQGFVVPKGVMHRPRAPERTVILMVEGAGIVPTGDS